MLFTIFKSFKYREDVVQTMAVGSRGARVAAAPLFAGCRGLSPPKNCWAIIFIKGLFTSHPIFFATILARK